jgi:hypothetical protein
MFLIWSPRRHYFLGFCWRQLTTGDYQPCLVMIVGDTARKSFIVFVAPSHL